MNATVIHVDNSSEIPLFGIDFLGIVDRGTNLLEIKPTTFCNLKCKYCFVNAGDYNTNFVVEPDYILENLRKVIEFKGVYDIEIHIAPYGESLLYPYLIPLVKQLSDVEGIERISMQSNGLLLNHEIINNLKIAGLTRINISLNTLNEKLACALCNCDSYDVTELLENINCLLDGGINVLFAPVWFPGKNDKDIEDIIQLVLDLRDNGYNPQQVQIGIQKYLIYKTGRKLKGVRKKTWKYFYQQLEELENRYSLKLKLSPQDFGITPRKKFRPINLKKGDLISAQVISRGRWANECIGKIDEIFGIKILLRKPLTFKPKLLNKWVKVKVIKANYKYNLITALFPHRSLPI